MNFDLQIDDEELLRCARGLDDWFVAQLSADSERLMSRPMTPADVRAEYRPMVAEKANFRPLLKAKMDLTRVRCWTPAGERVNAAEVEWKRSVFTPIVNVGRVWYMNRSMGVTLDISDLVIHARPCERDAFPFIRGDPCLI